MRHQVIEHLAAARANGALIQLFAKISNHRHHAAAIIVRKMRQHRRAVIFLKRILPQLAPLPESASPALRLRHRQSGR
jgi:hypothetical protein